MPFGLISNLVNAGTNIANAVIGSNQFYDNKRHELFTNDQNWERTKLLNKWNREYELEDRKYLAEREDTAIQRRAKDLAKAGINPLLVGGGGGAAASGTISSRNTSNYTPATYTPGYSPQIGNFPEIGDPIERMLEKERKIAEIEKIRAETKATGTNTKGTELDNIRKEVENRYREEQIKLEIAKTTQGNALTEQQTKNLVQAYMTNASQEQRTKAIFEIEKEGKILDNELKRLDKEIAELEKQGITEENAREAEKFEMMKEEKWLFYLDSISSSISRITDIGNNIKSLFRRDKKRK